MAADCSIPWINYTIGLYIFKVCFAVLVYRKAEVMPILASEYVRVSIYMLDKQFLMLCFILLIPITNNDNYGVPTDGYVKGVVKINTHY